MTLYCIKASDLVASKAIATIKSRIEAKIKAQPTFKFHEGALIPVIDRLGAFEGSKGKRYAQWYEAEFEKYLPEIFNAVQKEMGRHFFTAGAAENLKSKLLPRNDKVAITTHTSPSLLRMALNIILEGVTEDRKESVVLVTTHDKTITRKELYGAAKKHTADPILMVPTKSVIFEPEVVPEGINIEEYRSYRGEYIPICLQKNRQDGSQGSVLYTGADTLLNNGDITEGQAVSSRALGG